MLPSDNYLEISLGISCVKNIIEGFGQVSKGLARPSKRLMSTSTILTPASLRDLDGSFERLALSAEQASLRSSLLPANDPHVWPSHAIARMKLMSDIDCLPALPRLRCLSRS